MTRVIGSTDVYSRKHIDRQNDRLDRRVDHHGDRLKDLIQRVGVLEQLLAKTLGRQD